MSKKLLEDKIMTTHKNKIGKLLLSAVMALGFAGTAQASIFGPVNGSGWSIFGPVHGSGWDINHDGKDDIGNWSIFGPVSGSGWSIFGPVNGSGWDINHDGKDDIGNWSIFGPVNGSGWDINHDGMPDIAGWSIFGPVNGSGWNIACLYNCSGNFGLQAPIRGGAPMVGGAPYMPGTPVFVPVVIMPQMMPQTGPVGGLPAGVVQCSFSDEVTLLAKSVSDCETAGGEVQQSATSGEGSDSTGNDG